MMKLKKKKKVKEEVKSEKVVEKKTRRKKKVVATGSRFGALVLLFISVLISVGFYFWGIISTKGFDFSLGETQKTWEYSR